MLSVESPQLTIKDRLINVLMPARMKRVFFLATLWKILATKFGVTDAKREDLFKLFPICPSEETFKLPEVLTESIWADRQVAHMGALTDGLEVRVINSVILDDMPGWMRYGKDDKLKSDIGELVNYMKDKALANQPIT